MSSGHLQLRDLQHLNGQQFKWKPLLQYSKAEWYEQQQKWQYRT